MLPSAVALLLVAKVFATGAPVASGVPGGNANPLGLFSEDIDPKNGRPLGNFPRADTHVGLIHAAITIGELSQHATSASVHGRRRWDRDLGRCGHPPQIEIRPRFLPTPGLNRA